MELRQVERYWETRVELVSSLKKTQFSIWTEVSDGIYVVDVEEASLDEAMAKGYAPTAVSTSSHVLPLSRYVQATHAALASLRALPDFEPLQGFEPHLQEEYGGFRRDQIQRIHDFRRENDDTPRTIYTRLGGLPENLDVCSRKVSW